MPFVFIIVGIVMLISGVRGTSQNLLTLVKNDFSGYVFWFLSIMVIGALGYIQELKELSRSFLVLLLIVLVLSEDKNGNSLVKNFQSALSQITGTNVGVS